MDLDIEKVLYDVPEGQLFPMELSHHLRKKLNSVIEENCFLKRHVTYLDKEVMDLRKAKREREQQESKGSPSHENYQSDSLMASKICELSKKNREMTAQMESLRCKFRKVQAENENLRKLRESNNKRMDNTSRRNAEPIAEMHPVPQDDEDLMVASTQLTQVTSKMMEYRRQVQQLKIELKAALRALAQEVGDTVTPQSVLTTVSHPAWRGRQQQIIALQQKVAELQIKMARSDALDSEAGQGDGDGSRALNSCASSLVSVASINSNTHRTGLMQHDMKKQEQLRKLSSEIEQLRQEVQTKQQELKASKARIHTLENQVKSTRSQMDIYEAKFQEKELEIKSAWDEMNHIKQDLISTRDREKRNTDKLSLENQEMSRALIRERAIVARLQEVINEKQETIQKADSQVIELKNKLELSCSSKVAGGLNAVERLQELETQLSHYSKLLLSSESEQKRLIDLVDAAGSEVEMERQKVMKAQRECAQAMVVLQEANKCIDNCLDAGNVTDPIILQAVENIRTMIRELKTGELFSLNYECSVVPCSSKKLRIKIDLLGKEIAMLKNNLQELEERRKGELSKHARIYENVKKEFTDSFPRK